MRGCALFCLIVWLVTRKTNADISSQSLTASPRVSGIPPIPVICSWAHCKGLCQSEITEDSLSCSAILLPFGYVPEDVFMLNMTNIHDESRCPTQQAMPKYKVCIGPASESRRSRCKLKGTQLCFPQYHDTVTNRNHTELCRTSKTCQDLSQLCLSSGYTNCSFTGYTTFTTSNPPTTMSRDLSTRNQPVRTPDDLTSEHNVSSSFNPPITTNASSMNPPITDSLDSLISLVVMIGIVIGVLLISLILVVILLLCVIRKYRRKKFGVPKQGESFEMNEDGVYHAIGPACPELPPNHPTLGKEGNPSNHINTSGSSCSLEVTMETTQVEAENLQGNQNAPYYVLESTDQQYQEGMKGDISRKTGSNYINASNTPYVDNQVYNSGFLKAGDHGKNGPDITRVYTQLQGNGKEYSQTNDVTDNAYETSTRDNFISDKPYMALHATDVDSGDVTASEKETDSSESLLHSRQNSVDDVIESRDITKGAGGPEKKKDKKLSDTDVLQDPTSYNAKKVSEQECGAEVNETERPIKTIEDNGSGPNESPSCNYQQGSTTFPRPKSLKVPTSGSATPKKSKFLSLRFGSKKRSKLSKKKLKSFCSADVSDFCLDLNISSPTSPAEERDDSFFTAAVPIIHAPPQEPKVVPEQLSKSQEAIFDDVNNEPFRNRSLSQPIRKTFSPTLCKEYDEIKESWGATYLQVPSHDQK